MNSQELYAKCNGHMCAFLPGQPLHSLSASQRGSLTNTSQAHVRFGVACRFHSSIHGFSLPNILSLFLSKRPLCGRMVGSCHPEFHTAAGESFLSSC